MRSGDSQNTVPVPKNQIQLTGHQIVSYNQDTIWCPIYFRGGSILNLALQERDVYVAIADPTRRKIIRLLAESEELPLYELTPHFDMGRTAVSKHLSVLKAADLVTNRKIGRETRYRLNPAPLKEVQDWLSFYEQFWNESAMKLKKLLEE